MLILFQLNDCVLDLFCWVSTYGKLRVWLGGPKTLMKNVYFGGGSSNTSMKMVCFWWLGLNTSKNTVCVGGEPPKTSIKIVFSRQSTPSDEMRLGCVFVLGVCGLGVLGRVWVGWVCGGWVCFGWVFYSVGAVFGLGVCWLCLCWLGVCWLGV